VVLLVAAGFMSSCAATPKGAAGAASPSLSSVVRGRFVSRVELDRGDLVVAPAGKRKARVSAKVAQAMFRAADVVDGAYRFAIIGLGVATISPEVSTTSTTGPGTPSTLTHPTTTTTTSSTTSTTAPPTTSSGSGSPSTGPSSTTSTLAPAPSAPPLPRYVNRLAWVGIAWGADCPATAGHSELATRYVAVVFDADTGRSVLSYTSRSSVACSGPVQPPTIGRPSELVSVPWQAVGPSSTGVRVTMPACSSYFGWTEVPGAGAASVEVQAREPFDPECGSTAPVVEVVGNVVPLGTVQAQVTHAPLGPVDALRTLAAN
jgi:hypothetical protein